MSLNLKKIIINWLMSMTDKILCLGEANLIFWFAYRGRVIILLPGERILFPIIAGQTILFPYLHLKNLSFHAYYGRPKIVQWRMVNSEKTMTIFTTLMDVVFSLVSQRKDLIRMKAKLQIHWGFASLLREARRILPGFLVVHLSACLSFCREQTILFF